ncbi:oligoribonuclease [Candidatus Saccharibacteria bacterium]|nr:MAG: oligoribonuclease [Candidatus Saccharibacteria bacterium]
MTYTKILWVDLEMTGLEPTVDRILEIGAIITDWDFKPIAQFEAVVCQDEAFMKQRMQGPFFEENSQTRDALWAQNGKGLPEAEVEQQFIDFIRQHIDDESVLLAGNSIHQDRRFIAQWMPKLNKMLHYRMLDVSAWKVVFEDKYGKKFAKPEEHRALSDIQGSIEELKYYLKKVKA